ncbi:hypothetical protein JCM33374_g2333 [Metschnikowia sp. JCM 33374]|nr:hypothetical protein JCM33374_g2333 [Metschnikowia sp. JCM 33374]
MIYQVDGQVDLHQGQVPKKAGRSKLLKGPIPIPSDHLEHSRRLLWAAEDPGRAKTEHMGSIRPGYKSRLTGNMKWGMAKKRRQCDQLLGYIPPEIIPAPRFGKFENYRVCQKYPIILETQMDVPTIQYLWVLSI